VQILPPMLRRFQEHYPGVRVALHDLSTEEMLAQLRDGQLQAALLVRPTRAMLRSLKFKELACYPMCVAVAPTHPLAKKKSTSLAQIAGEPLIAYSRVDYPEYHEDLSAIFAPVKSRPRIAEEHDGVTSLIAAVEAGRGIALVPSCLTCMVGPRLKLIPLKPAVRDIIVGAAWKPETLTPIAEKFIALAQGNQKP
jgi:DNA-binding transcriptional LysR family regulator